MKHLFRNIIRALGLEVKDTVYGYGIPDDAELRKALIAAAQEVDPQCEISFPDFSEMHVRTWYENHTEMYHKLDRCMTEYFGFDRKAPLT